MHCIMSVHNTSGAYCNDQTGMVGHSCYASGWWTGSSLDYSAGIRVEREILSNAGLSRLIIPVYLEV